MANLCVLERCAFLLTVPVDTQLQHVLDMACASQVIPIDRGELHISLSRPTILRDHERAAYIRQVANAVRGVRPFVLSFSHFECFPSDTSGRVFLAVEIGAGKQHLSELSRMLDAVQNSFHAPSYYNNAHFHTSFAYIDSNCTIPNSESRQAGYNLASSLESGIGNALRAVPPIATHDIGIKWDNTVEWVPLNRHE